MEGKNKISVGLTLLIVGIMLMAVPAVPNRAAEVNDVDTVRVLIFQEGKNLDRLMASPDVTTLVDYGTHRLSDVSPSVLELLRSYDIYFEIVNYRIGIGEYSFDTSLGEPALPQSLHLYEYPGETGYYIIQVMGPMKDDWSKNLESEGIRIVEYLNNAIIAEATPMQINTISSMNFINWAGLYQPAYKLTSVLGQDGDQTVYISLFRGEHLKDVMTPLIEMGAEIHDFEELNIGGIIIATVNANQINSLARLKAVSQITAMPQNILYNDVATRVVQSGQATTTGLRVIHDRGLHGQNQLINMVDTGLYQPHEMFTDSNPIGPSHRKIRDYYAAGGDLLDGHGHGTHVAGTIMGDAPTHLTYNTRDGHAFAGKIIVADIGVGTGISPNEDYDTIWNPAYNLGSRISSNSWGTSYAGSPYSDVYPNHARQLDDYVWRNPEFLFVWAAGNAGAASSIGFQSQAKSILIVGGTENGANANNMYTSSSRGPTKDLRLAPHILAPAVSINSASRTTNSYTTMSGTSMATPAISGNVALIRQYLAEGWYPQGIKNSGDPITNPSAALVKSLMVISGKEISGTGAYANGEVFYPNNQQGWGRAYIDDVLYFDGQAKKLKFWDSPTPMSTGGNWQQTITVTDNTVPLRVMLAWSDYPGAVGSNPSIINDLDLTVTDSLGNVYRGNVFTGSNPGHSTTGGSYDRRNTFELVNLLPGYGNGVPLGTYTINVNGFSVANGPQNFATTILGAFIQDTTATATGPIGTSNSPSVTITYTWTMTPTSVELYYTRNGGSTWTLAGTDNTVDGSFPYTITAGDGTYGWIARARGGGSTEPVPPGGTAPEASPFVLDTVPPASPTGLTVQHWGPGGQSSSTTETRYMRDNTQTINGLTAYTLATTQSATGTSNTEQRTGGSGQAVTWGTRVWKRASSGTETEITGGSMVATVQRTANGNGIQSATWACPGAVLATTDSIVVRVYHQIGTNPVLLMATYTGEQLGATDLDAGTWTIYYYTARTTGGGGPNQFTAGTFYWGTATYNSRIENFAYSIEIPGDPLWHNTLNWSHAGTGVDHYNIYRSDAQAGTYTLIGTSPVGTNTYCDLNMGQADTTRWWYRVRAEDAAGNIETNTNSVQEPGVVVTPPYAISLTSKTANSWVFVSFPSGLTGAINTVLNDATAGDGLTTWTVAKSWDNVAKKWLTYRVGGTVNTLTNVNNTMGVWLWLTANGGDQVLTLSSYVANPTANTNIYLKTGWNMVGYPSATNRLASATLPAQADMVAVWQATSPYIADSAPGAVTMSHGNAYWVRVTADATWAVAP